MVFRNQISVLSLPKYIKRVQLKFSRNVMYVKLRYANLFLKVKVNQKEKGHINGDFRWVIDLTAVPLEGWAYIPDIS